MLPGGRLLTAIAVILVAAAPPVYASFLITPTFASNIATDPNAAAIEATINAAINIYEAKFVDPINVAITFQEGGGLGASSFLLYQDTYSDFRAHLASDATSADDTTALAHLASGTNNPVTATSIIQIKSANARALGYDVATFLNPQGYNGSDGTITLNTSLTTPGTGGSGGTSGLYSLMSVVEHEIDEILGLGSTLGLGEGSPANNEPSPEDLFRYDSTGHRSYTLNSAVAFFSLDATTDLAQFNNAGVNGGDYGDWQTGAGPVRVQDATATAHSAPVLGVELRALDVIGYTLAPEPSTGILLLSALGILASTRRRRSSLRR